MADSSAVDLALTGKLLADATLMSIMTDGVYFDVAKSGATKFVILGQQAHEDDYAMPSTTAYERFLYLVKAVATHTSGADVKNAAARIHTLLQFGTMTITGYTLMVMSRENRVRYTEVDPDNEDLRWQHRGGVYEVVVSPT